MPRGPIKPYLQSVSLKDDVELDFNAYPYSLPAVRALDVMRFHPDVTFLIGENGSGKSTLLEAIAVRWGFNAEGGSINFNFATRASHSDLHENLRMARSTTRPTDGFFLRAESFFNVATQVEELGVSGYGRRSLHEQSHGESFMALLLNRFGGNGLYLLDEPEAALSPTRQLSALCRMHDLVKDGSQFIIATHSPILLAYPGAKIYQLDANGYAETLYEETEHYRVTKEFLNHPARMLKELLAD
jgi:predicted ATPase